MSTRTLDDLITDGGIRSAYFFNGRLLSGEDLRQEQDANRQARRALGQSIGHGVAYGLDVTQRTANLTSPTLTIAPGLAINRLGQTLRLSTAVDLSLVRPPTATTGTDILDFRDCVQPLNGVYIVDSGVYLLAVCPISAKQGRAPVSGLGNETSACNSKYTVEGVQFLLASIAASDLPVFNTLQRRNLVAYRAFGLDAWSATPFGAQPAEIGLVDHLRATGRLHDCDVPLAVFAWVSGSSIEDLDTWAVRRRITRPWPDDESFSVLSDTRRSVAEAGVLQFRSHLESLLASGAAATAAQAFRYLPPVGYLPVGVGGVNWPSFLGGLTDGRLTRVSPGLLREIVQESLDIDPIDTTHPVPVRVYAHAAADSFVVFARSKDGRVNVSFTTNVPVGADIWLKSRDTNFQAVMNPAGSVFAADARPGSYTITVDASGFHPFKSPVLEVVGGEFVNPPAIALSPIVTTGTIVVNIAQMPQLSQDIGVQVDGQGATHAATRAGSDFTAPNLSPGSYTATAIVTFIFNPGTPDSTPIPFHQIFQRLNVQVSAGQTTTVQLLGSDLVGGGSI
jgi:hypothetical protein